jgi:hypothetical protein
MLIAEKVMEFPPEVTEQLGHYVYLYIDPDTDVPFYIGKGVGNRVFAHLGETAESEKVAKIQELRDQGKMPKIELLRYGMSESEAALVEASVIDFIGTGMLTNKVRGYHSRSYGRISAEEILTTFTAQPVEITHKVLLITINRLYRSGMSSQELYEATRGIWKVGRRRARADYAFAVYRGIVREVYQIDQWHPAGTLAYETRDDSDFRGSGRWEFGGEIALDIREIYVANSIRDYLGTSNQNPIRYVNI